MYHNLGSCRGTSRVGGYNRAGHDLTLHTHDGVVELTATVASNNMISESQITIEFQEGSKLEILIFS